jgi:HD-GYP domain-containing protein (c-di-GMP phosphodiesterase class II)
VNAEKELLEQTLSGSIHVLTEVLSLVSPAAFGRAVRLRRYIRHIVAKMSLGSPWKIEVAAMMSQLGCVTLDHEIIDAVYAGRKLSPAEQALYDKHPMVAHDLLINIPRMEPIAWMIAHQKQPAAVEGDVGDRGRADIRLGAEILSVTLAFDEFLRQGLSKTEAAHRLGVQRKHLDRRIFEALVELESDTDQKQTRTCAIGELSTGMILEQEVRSDTGLLVVAKGQEVTQSLILKLKNFSQRNAMEGGVTVSLPKSLSFSKSAS